ncbi:bifunctional hydroxymethylpyrimidine kinase/phosphomethylpyrimidine kinase [Carnimonas bestiolae]|uniref:bifunctional hydroxymethylpyrimidine kinase/phosphomethylpyrimidine kinase n=1 Tax=Carnimonas bestiolae TaxID=3402172 RepID=UPI003F4A8708
MPTSASTVPVVLVLAGHDPTNGAGIGADQEAIRSGGGWALSVATALTVQDSSNVSAVYDVAPDYLRAAALTATADIRPQAIKIGLLTSKASAQAVVALLDEFPSVPIVVDPVLKAGGGKALTDDDLAAEVRASLLPRATVVTPNRSELARLVPEQPNDEQRALTLCSEGSAVLITGTDPLPEEAPSDDAVVHRLYQRGQTVREWRWPRLQGSYHGSGCTLAARIALELSLGQSLAEACERAQRYTWRSLEHAQQLGEGQYLPDRWYGNSSQGREGNE